MPNRRSNDARKYMYRRITLIAITLAAVGVGGYFLYTGVISPMLVNAAKKDEVASSVSSQVSVAPVSSKAESSKPPESESKSESEPATAAETEIEAEQGLLDIKAGNVKGWNLILVNKKSKLPDNFNIELETITDIYKVDKRIAPTVRKMFADAKKDGITLQLCSAYRSVEKQEELFRNKTAEYVEAGKNEQEAQAVASTIVAIPKTSEHHTGLALDIITPAYTNLDSGFEDTPAFKWLDKNAHKYGFVLRFPKGKQDVTAIIYEPWHYRFVGIEDAKIMKDNALTLEEYHETLGNIQKEMAESEAKAKEATEGDTEGGEVSE